MSSNVNCSKERLAGLVLRAFLGTVMMCAAATAVVAQERTGSIQGTVTDASGAAVPNAMVEASSEALLRTARVTTDSGGGYLFPSLPPGAYNISVTQKGFSTWKASNINVLVGRVFRVDAKLEVGQVTESVVVSGDAVVVDTASTVISTNVTSSIYDKLPKGRNFDSLLAMAPGTRPEPKSGGFQVDGSSGSENSFVIDGVEVTNIQTGVLNRQSQIPVEWVAETQVKSSGIDAQYGGAIGGVVSAVTKSGSNNFHGQLSLYNEVDGMDGGPRPTLTEAGRTLVQRLNPTNDDIAENFVNAKDGFRRINPGFNIGGRIVRDKLWFFASAYPQLDKYNRTVTYLRGGNTLSYESRVRQDFSMARLDYQPLAKLRTNFSYMYNPLRENGQLPSRQGTDAESNPWADRGSRRPATSYNWQADWTATSKMLVSVFGGYQYFNYKDYGIPGGTRYRFANGNGSLPASLPIPSNLVGVAGNFTPDNRQTVKDVFTRYNVNAIASYLGNWHGQHNIRGGYQLNRLANSPVAGTWPDGYIFLYWDRTYNAITKPGSFRGRYGYYINRVFATEGDVSSNNLGLFLQDTWRVNRNLTLTLGIRTEREFVPSFSDNANLPSKAITFGFGKKLAPRLGFAWDPSGTGRQKVYGSFGRYYDIMKYELPRGSFGGDKWKDYFYTLDDPNFFNIKPNPAPRSNTGTFPGTAIEVLDRRIPSNDPSEGLLEPDLKPVRTTNWDFGYDHSFSNSWVAGLRYTHRQLDHTIEDVGILTPLGEQYYIANPGFGLTIDPRRFPAGYPANVTPKAQRDYDAMEFKLEKRYAKNFFFQGAYIWSRLYGNYAGLASSDENGRTSPNVNRYFDEAWMSYDAAGKLVYGRLPTDRPHTFKIFGSYDLNSKAGTTHFGPYFFVGSGTPVTTEVDVQDVPAFSFGRGDLGRTPVFSQTDFLVYHEFGQKWLGEGRKFRLEFNVTNLFNQETVTDRYKTITHANDGAITFRNTADIFKGYDVAAGMKQFDIRRDPRYNLASNWQSPRYIRWGFHFIF
jgi:hypothetical protein